MKTGDKVVCIAVVDMEKKFVVVGEQPQEGEIFVIRKSAPIGEFFSLQLIGVEVYLGMEEVGWHSNGFRLLDDMKKSAR
jgi:hypothetical protein